VPGKRHGASEDGSIAVKASPARQARGVSTRGVPEDARERAFATKGRRAPERDNRRSSCRDANERGCIEIESAEAGASE
jgi:hypothetical protein